LLVSFGGPEGPDDVVPFLQNVTRGRNIPAERLKLVGQHYFHRGGISPINEQCRELRAAFVDQLAVAGIDLPVYWGNRNWDPFLVDAVQQMADDGRQHVLAFVTSAFGSYSGCRQYRENIEAARQEVGSAAPSISKLRLYFNHPGFIEPMIDHVVDARRSLDLPSDEIEVLFTAHSIPIASAATCDYQMQIESACELIVEGARGRLGEASEWKLVWQSRSGPPSMPWLEPDICDAVRTAAADGNRGVVVVPVGFISDHMEVLQDLDTDALAAAEGEGIDFARASTVGTDERFVSLMVDLVREQLDGATPVTLGELGPVASQCSATCCPAPMRPSRPGARPA